MLVTIKDETFSGQILNETPLEFKDEIVSVREIITERVLQEVENYNYKLPEYFQGLVEPNDSEKTLNGFKLKPKIQIDGEKQVYVALDAFQKNGYFLIINDSQAESLEQMVTLRHDTVVSFIKLTPLVGG